MILGVILGLLAGPGGLIGLLCLMSKVGGYGWLGFWRD
jgi:hypothetical protein